MPSETNPNANSTTNAERIDTGGGTFVGGNVNTGGDYLSGNKYVTNITQVMAANPAFFFLNVPAMPPNFVGREALVAELVERLCNGESTALSAEGLPGVGKTTLAVALARHATLLQHFSDGVLWAGLGRNPDVAGTQTSWAEALGAEIRDILDPLERMWRISNAIGLRRVLLVLDDAWQLEAAQQLRASAPNVVHLLTTRDQELARHFAGATQQHPVPPLERKPSHELLQRLAPEAWASDPAAAQTLADRVDGLPLTLELLGGYLGESQHRRTHSRRQQALRHLSDPAARLQLATRRLGDSRQQQVTLQETITLSLQELAQSTVDCFYSLGAFAPKPARFELAAALAVSQSTEDDLLALADRNLLEWGEDETLALHQSLHDLARSHLPAEVSERHRDYYLAEVYKDHEDWQRIEAIYEQIGFAWQQTAQDDPTAIHFVDSLSTFQRRRGNWQDRLDWLAKALNVANQSQDEQATGRMLSNLGYVYDALGEKQKALDFYQQALPLQRQVGDKAGEATTLNNIGAVYDALGEKQKALDFYQQALPLRRQVGDKGGEASTLNNIGAVYDALGEKEKALDFYQQTLQLVRQVGDKGGEAYTLTNLGAVYSALGEKQKALDFYQQALPLRRQVGDKGGEAYTLNNLGAVYDALGEKQKALDFYQQALTLQRQVGDKGGEAITLSNIGVVYDALGEQQKALDFYQQALPLRRQVGDKGGEAYTLNNMAVIAYHDGDYEAAAEAFGNILPITEQIGDVANMANVLVNLAFVLHHQLQRSQEAIECMERSIALLQAKQLPLDAFGRTVEEHREFLAQLRSQQS